MSRVLLCIDPDPATRVLVQKVLTPGGFTVLAAGNARDGSRLAEHSPPELVLIDVDGADAAADVVRTFRQVPGMEQSILVASTSDHRHERLSRAMESGFQGVLVKPLDIDTLAQELSRHLRPAGENPDAGAPAVPRRRPPEPDSPIHPLWRRTLAPVMASAVHNAATAYGLLVLHDNADDALVLVATHSLRSADDVPPIRTRVPLSTAEWLRPALTARQTALLQGRAVERAALVPAARTIVLAAPVFGEERIYGVVIFGERRQRPFGMPDGQLAQCVAEAARIGTILQEFERRDETVLRRRREIDHARLAAARAIAAGVPLDLNTQDADAARRVRLGLDLADRLALRQRSGSSSSRRWKLTILDGAGSTGSSTHWNSFRPPTAK